jgi:hypothetical protein
MAMTQQYLAGELSLRLAQLQDVARGNRRSSVTSHEVVPLVVEVRDGGPGGMVRR